MRKEDTGKSILVAYTTNSGSTTEVAEAVGETLSEAGLPAEVRRLEEVTRPESYAAAVIGAPLILGWHRTAVRFVKRHRETLSTMPVALFFTAMSLTGAEEALPFPTYVDPELIKPPARTDRLTFKERYATRSNYLRPVFKVAPQLGPVSAAFFGGKLELYRLNPLQMLFVMLVIGSAPGDRRNWTAIREWGGGLPPLLCNV